ncbi:MAG TPA: Ig-like domain-containing protein [Chloroflexota bacterium]
MTQVVLSAGPGEARSARPPQRWRGGVLVVALVIAGVAALVLARARTESSPRGALDAPLDGALVETPLEISGWAIDSGSSSGSGVDRVQVFLDGTLLADAQYGQPRPDIGAAFGARFEPSGWSTGFDPRPLPAGAHRLEVRARSTVDGQETVLARAVDVAHPSTPRGAIDAPADGAPVVGALEVRGWAIDQQATDGAGVSEVMLFLDGEPVGAAEVGRARPDIAASFGPQFDLAGWSATLDVAPRAVGRHVLEARARSTLSSAETTYAVALEVRRPSDPHGSLDAPAEGARVRGPTTVRGWALDEAVADGPGVERVQLYVDDVLVGMADYGQQRPELGSAYGPRFVGAGWSAEVDFGALAPGEHRLEARARSSATGEETAYGHVISITP